MGYTHHDKISVVNGLAFGSATAGETVVMDSTGNVTVAGTLTGSAGVSYDTNQGVMSFATILAAGSSTTIWFVAPYACDITGYCSYVVSSGTGRTVSIAHGSAGDNVCATATAGATGTIGVVVGMVASAVPSAMAQEVMRVVTTTCATAQTYGVTLVLTKT